MLVGMRAKWSMQPLFVLQRGGTQQFTLETRVWEKFSDLGDDFWLAACAFDYLFFFAAGCALRGCGVLVRGSSPSTRATTVSYRP